MCIILIYATPFSMSTLRFKVVEEAFKREPISIEVPKEFPSKYFGKYVFNRNKMSKYLSKDTMSVVVKAIDEGLFASGISDHVAAGIKCGNGNGCNPLHSLVSTID